MEILSFVMMYNKMLLTGNILFDILLIFIILPIANHYIASITKVNSDFKLETYAKYIPFYHRFANYSIEFIGYKLVTENGTVRLDFPIQMFAISHYIKVNKLIKNGTYIETYRNKNYYYEHLSDTSESIDIML